jgi:hypothetical protein
VSGFVLVLWGVRQGTMADWTGTDVACNHPSLVSKDYRVDKDAADPKATGNDEDDADDLTAMFENMGMSGARKCQLCQTAYVRITRPPA